MDSEGTIHSAQSRRDARVPHGALIMHSTLPEAPRQILVTARQAATILSISPRLLSKKTAAGEIPHVRVTAKAVRYRVADLERWSDSRVKARVA